MKASFLNWVRSGTVKGANEVDRVFAQRPVLDDDQFFETYFSDGSVAKNIALGVRSAFIENLPFDMRRLAPSDSFKGELNFVWRYDSLADVELICEIEKRFNVKITADEARNAATMGDLIHLVNAKSFPNHA
jgi:acyl carrier protein